MKKIIIIYTIILILSSTLVLAIPNPAWTRCRLYGGQYNDVYNNSCTLKDGIKCDPMDGKLGDRGEPCNQYTEMPCVDIGGGPTENSCCENLVRIQTKKYFNSLCVWDPPTGYNSVCTECGDGQCDKLYENKCNCSADCGKPYFSNFIKQMMNWFKNLF